MGSALATLESDTVPAKRRPGQRGKDLTGSQVADILRWHVQGLTQKQIGAKLEPVRSQSAISDVIARLGIDNTVQAKAILRGGAADMALNIVKKGQAKDHVNALKGLGVLEEQQHSGLTVIVGGSGQVTIGVLVGGESRQLEPDRT